MTISSSDILVDMKLWYADGLNLFAAKIDAALAIKGDAAAFRDVLIWALGPFGMSPKALHEGMGVSTAAISKWINNKAVTTAPTQTAILHWIRDQVDVQINALDKLSSETLKM